MDAAELVAAARTELAPVECMLAEHRYLGELEAGPVPLESLRAFAGEQRLIVTSDRRSFEHLAHRFPQPPASGFFREMAAGEAEALRLLEPFATAWASVPTTSRFLGARPIRPMCAWLAVNGSPADVALAFVANLQSWGRSWRTKWKRMRKALATRVTGLSFGVLVATPALADVSTTQTLPGAGPATPGR